MPAFGYAELGHAAQPPRISCVVALAFRSGLLHFVEISLKLGHLVGDETECVVQGEVFDIRLVVLGLVAKLVEFGKDRFGLHQYFHTAASAPRPVSFGAT